MKTKKERKQAISLIVLIITIIVMIVLAGAIVLTLNNSGIIDKAQEAVDKTNEAQIQEIAQLAWADAYLDGEKTDNELRHAVMSTLEENGVDTTEYGVIATSNGVKVAKGWLQDGIIVTKGEQVLEVGDTIAYDETEGGTITGLTATDWKVLGANDDGNLLIMATTNVTKLLLGDETKGENLAKAQNDYVTGIEQLNNICLPYGAGTGAIESRSITVDDINRITGYNPNEYNRGTVQQYENEVTYYWDGTEYPAYKSSVVNGKLIESHSQFVWYDEEYKTWTTLEKSTTATEENLQLITSPSNSKMVARFKCTMYSGYSETLQQLNGKKAYSMILSGGYWLASQYLRTYNSLVFWGIRYINNIGVYNAGLVFSNGGTHYSEYRCSSGSNIITRY